MQRNTPSDGLRGEGSAHDVAQGLVVCGSSTVRERRSDGRGGEVRGGQQGRRKGKWRVKDG